jgi:CRP/FNR family transcriptional regulator, cyclic AMP receptor protein
MAAVIASDAIGYLASALVLAAFCMKEMVPLRVVAVCSNIAFLIYGLALGLVPVWLLHAVLLPINCWRLWEDLAQPLSGRGPLTLSIIPNFAGRILRRR